MKEKMLLGEGADGFYDEGKCLATRGQLSGISFRFFVDILLSMTIEWTRVCMVQISFLKLEILLPKYGTWMAEVEGYPKTEPHAKVLFLFHKVDATGQKKSLLTRRHLQDLAILFSCRLGIQYGSCADARSGYEVNELYVKRSEGKCKYDLSLDHFLKVIS